MTVSAPDGPTRWLDPGHPWNRAVERRCHRADDLVGFMCRAARPGVTTFTAARLAPGDASVVRRKLAILRGCDKWHFRKCSGTISGAEAKADADTWSAGLPFQAGYPT